MATSFSTSGQPKKTHHQRKRASTRGLIFAVLILLIFVGMWIGMKLYLGSLETKNKTIVQNIENAHSNYDPVQVGEVMDFYERLEIVERVNAEHDNIMVRVLSDIEKIMVPRAVLSAMELNRSADGEDIVTIGGDVEAFDILAQQELAMRDSGYFTDIEISDTDFDDAGRITFELTAVYVGGSSQE